MRLGSRNPALRLQDSNPDDFYLLGAQIRGNYRKGMDSADAVQADAAEYVPPAGLGGDTGSSSFARELKTSNEKLTYWNKFFNRFEYCAITPTPGSSKSRLGKQEAFIIEYDVKENLLALSKKLHLSLFDVLFGCFTLLLNKFTQQNNIAVRTNIDERLYAPQYAETLGCFINNLFLGVEIDADATLLDLLIEGKKNKDQAIRHGLSYDTLIERFREKTIDLSRIHFNLDLRDLNNTLGLYLSQIQTHSGHVKSDLYVELDVKKDKILARVEYKVEAFDKNFIDSLIQCYTNILKKAELFLNQPVKSINILSDAQYHQVVHSFNADKNYPSARTIHQIFEEQVEKNPKQVAVSCNGTLLTYEQLNAKANQLAHYLRQHDEVVPGALITLCLEKNEQILIAILAVLKAGAAYVPLDPQAPEDRMRYMLEDTNSPVIITSSMHRQKMELHNKATVIAIDGPLFVENLNKQPIKNPDINTSNAELAYMIYTSGTTGNPKGVMQTHANLVRLFAATEDLYRFKNDDVWLLFHSYVFDVSIWEMWGALFYGGKLVIPTEDQTKDPHMLYSLCYHEQVTVFNLTPHAFYQFSDVAIHKEKLPLKWIMLAGEALSTKRLKPWTQYYGLRQPKLINMYGITETAVLTTYKEIIPENVDEGSASIGKAFPDTRTYVLDAHLMPVPLGAAGELYLGGAGLAKGYWNKPQLTRERFVRNPFQMAEEDARLYKTGDVVRWLPDGELEYVGRNDHQVKIRGYRVELGDIANNLLEHPFISEAVVLAIEDPTRGAYLAAYYVVGENRVKNNLATFDTSAAQLRQFLEKKLPHYMLPTSYTKLDTIPLTVQGKVDRKKLLSLTNKNFDHSSHYVPPRTRHEIAMVEIWAKVLKLDKNIVGIEKDFFALGGHSLLVTNLISQINAKFDVDLQVRDLFIKPTIQGLLSLIDKRRASTDSQHHKMRIEIDFDAEASLPEDIYPERTGYEPVENPQNIFLTGANGFLGGYLLEELLNKTTATIYCLVRAGSNAEAEHKLFSSLKEKYIAVDAIKHRIVALAGDLAQPHFALSEETFALLTKEIDVIYHNGAAVNFLYPYEFLKAANVDSVKEVLHLAKTTRLKPVHYISTLAVFASLHLKRSITVINEDQQLDFGDQLFMGYPETKWVAEKLLCEAKKRGFPICIYRFMEVTGHSKTGVSNTKSLDMAFLKGCIEMGLTGDLPMKKYYTPVDYLAQAIVYLSQQTTSVGQNFHLHNPNPISQQELVKILNDFGYPIDCSPHDTWVQKIVQASQNSLYIYHPLFTEKWTEENISVVEMFAEQRRPHYGFQHASSGLAGSGLICPKIDRQYIHRCLNYLINVGYIREPKIKAKENDFAKKMEPFFL
jgi:amino acid adenylation domain-containing protein/thioester reductase-like protein